MDHVWLERFLGQKPNENDSYFAQIYAVFRTISDEKIEGNTEEERAEWMISRAKELYESSLKINGRTSTKNPFLFGEYRDLPISNELKRYRLNALREGIPTMEDDGLFFLLERVKEVMPKRILEIGTAIGITALAMKEVSGAEIITIEKNQENAKRAREVFSDGITLLEGDAMEIIVGLKGEFDFILLDGPKVQYIKYLPYLKNLLKKGGVLYADDVLLYGWVNGKNEVPKKRRMLVQHIREYLDEVQNDPSFETKIYEIGEGVAVSRKL